MSGFKERLLQLKFSLEGQERVRSQEQELKRNVEEKTRQERERERQRKITTLGELAERNFRPILQSVNDVFASGGGKIELELNPWNSPSDEGFTKNSAATLIIRWEIQRRQAGTLYIEEGKHIALSLGFDNSIWSTGQDPKEKINLSDENWKEKVYDTILDAIRLRKHIYADSNYPHEDGLGISGF